MKRLFSDFQTAILKQVRKDGNFALARKIRDEYKKMPKELEDFYKKFNK